MKKVVLYTLLFFTFSSCSSEKILSDKIINKKWDINYVKSNLGNNPTISKQDKEGLITKDYKSKNLIPETEHFLASNDELIAYQPTELSIDSKKTYKEELFPKSYQDVLKSNQLEKNLNNQNVKNVKLKIEKLSKTSLLFNALGILFVADIFLQTGILLALGLIFSIIGFFLNLLVIYRIKKLKRKIKDQTRNVKINIILSSIFPLLLALSTLIIFVLTYSFSY